MGGPPHEALFHVLAYLPLYELLATSQVCRSLQDAINGDVLIWLDILVQKPLHVRLTDDILLLITSKSQGRLRTLALFNCTKITDGGLLRVVERNPLISKLHVQGCTSLTPEGVLTTVQTLTSGNHYLTSLKIAGINHISQQILAALLSCLPLTTTAQRQLPRYYHKRITSSSNMLTETTCSSRTDVEICRKCNEVTMVFDCPKEACKGRRDLSPQLECKGCCYCITRCEECGICVKDEDREEVICPDNVCLECWLRLPKCNFCNKPYCTTHAAERMILPSSSSGFVCDDCQFRAYIEETDDTADA